MGHYGNGCDISVGYRDLLGCCGGQLPVVDIKIADIITAPSPNSSIRYHEVYPIFSTMNGNCGEIFRY